MTSSRTVMGRQITERSFSSERTSAIWTASFFSFASLLEIASISALRFRGCEASEISRRSLEDRWHLSTSKLHRTAQRDAELVRLREMSAYAHSLGLEVHVGHGLTFETVGPVAVFPEVMELNIGHFLIGEAIFSGLDSAIRRMREAMDRAHQGWAEALNIDINELTIGPSTSINTYVMAQAIGASWQAGDEIVVTNQDHEANTGAVRRTAETVGASVREWRIDPGSGLLDPGRRTDEPRPRGGLLAIPELELSPRRSRERASPQ